MSTPSAADPIASVELYWLAFDLERAHRYARGVERRRELIIVRVLGDDGAEGWGECPTLSGAGYGTDTTSSAYASLRAELGPALCRLAAIDEHDNTMPAAALRDALLDRSLRREGQCLAALLGIEGTSVATSAVLALADDLGELRGRASARIDEGNRALKAKVEPGWSVEPVIALRAVMPEAVSLAADANGSFEPDALELAELDSAELAYIEQPVAGLDQPPLRTPVALDEPVVDGVIAKRWLEGGSGRMVNLKPSRVGGIARSVQLIESPGRPLGTMFVGGMLESGVGRTAALHVAAYLASVDPTSPPTDLGPTSSYGGAVCGPAIERDATGGLPVVAALGAAGLPAPDQLEKLTIEHCRVGRD